MKITTDFIGGNIDVKAIDGDRVLLDRDNRDSLEDWFYFAFGVSDAAGRTLTFSFPDNRLGPYGPAVSRDLTNWRWLGKEGNDFSYTFTDDAPVYFSHHMLYNVRRMEAFGERMKKETFCRGRLGTPVPCYTCGEGKTILLTARHHACESTGNYVMEGFLHEFLASPIEGFRVVAVPFIDYDGVLSGDQGKARAPYDHNRDYGDVPPIYPETAAVRALVDRGEVAYGFDFHSPYHTGGRNDTVFICEKDFGRLSALHRFSALLEEETTRAGERSMTYHAADNAPANEDWNLDATPTMAAYVLKNPACRLGFTLETAYFGLPDNVFSSERAVGLGRAFCRALRSFIADKT